MGIVWMLTHMQIVHRAGALAALAWLALAVVAELEAREDEGRCQVGVCRRGKRSG